MKKYLFIALAALGFAACAEYIDDPNAPIHNGELEESYIAINLMAADNDTRATDGGFEYGTAAEREIKNAYFFFFDENGNPFNIVGNPATAPGGEKNYLKLNFESFATGTVENVSDISNAVLILNTYKGIYPKQIVAVLNWIPTEETYSLDQLHEITTGLADYVNGGYVMSNSVYMDSAGKMVDAVAITEDNIKTSSEDALDAPIEIYVERIAAKVVLTAKGKEVDTNNIFNTQKTSDLFVTLGELKNTPVYVQLHGWELYNDYNTSHLVKNINTTWTDADLGFPWNNLSYYRCYWAESQNTALDDSFNWQYTPETQALKGFKTDYGFAVASASDTEYTDATTYTFCGENTNGTNKDLRTKVILKGQLMQKDGNDYKPLELASWYGNEYAGEDKLLIAVANSLAYTLFHSADGTSFSPIQSSDIMCDTTVAGTKSYETGFKLSSEGAAKTWYKYSSDGNHQPVGSLDDADDMAAKTNAYLAENVKPAMIYKNGMTYYMVDIEHLGNKGKTAEYGVVRNHVYQIDINSIKGYGSPVYSGLDFIVEQPEYPEVYEDSYVAARINVLSWKVVKQGVDIVQ